MIVGALVSGGAGFLVFFYIFYFGPITLTAHQPVQPIAFSHKLHAGDNKIECQYCHSNARRSESAGIPSVRKCMNCHEFVAVDSPKIEKVAQYYDRNEPIEWNRVYDLPDHVWFNHKRHIKKDIRCQTCHGPVETMEVLGRTVDHKMGFCLGCHQKKGAPTDCWTCHT